MSYPNRILKWLIAGLGIALVATAFRVTELVMASMVDHGHDWWRVFVWQLAGWGFWTLAAPVLAWRGEAIARSRPWWRALPAALLVGTALIALHVTFVAAVVAIVQQFEPVATYPFSVALSRQISRWLLVDVVAAVGLTTLGFVLASYRHARQLEVNESRLEADLARAELETLRLRMQPHFLFNILNSIAALIHRGDGQRAQAMIVELGEMLRETVGRSQRDTVSLRDELAFVNRYVELQRTRFPDRLEVHSSVPEECLGVGVPTLSLQPLIENAIRHGLSGNVRTLRVDVEAGLQNGNLQLSVSDDGEGLPESFDIERDAGLGVGNLRSRLKRMFGDGAELALERRSGGGTIALLTLPAIEMALEESDPKTDR